MGEFMWFLIFFFILLYFLNFYEKHVSNEKNVIYLENQYKLFEKM